MPGPLGGSSASAASVMALLEGKMPQSVGEASEGASLGEQDASATASTAVAMMASGRRLVGLLCAWGVDDPC